MNVPFTQNNGGQPRKPFNCLQIFGAALIMLFILGGLFWGGQWTYDQLAKTTPDDTESTSESTQKPGEKEPVATNQSGDSQKKQSAQSNGTLLKTGPADTAAIFAITVLAGSAAYQIKLRREV